MKKLLTKEEFDSIFIGIWDKKYSQIKEEILGNPKYSPDKLWELYVDLIPKSRFKGSAWFIEEWLMNKHVEIFYWNVRFFLNNAYRDNYLGYPYDGYIYAKILALKTAFIYWAIFQDKIEQTIPGFSKIYSEYYTKYWNNIKDGVEIIEWKWKQRTFRKFTNDIKHNLDFLTNIYTSFSREVIIDYDEEYQMMANWRSYEHDEISDFFFNECFVKLLNAFNDLVEVYNNHHFQKIDN